MGDKITILLAHTVEATVGKRPLILLPPTLLPADDEEPLHTLYLMFEPNCSRVQTGNKIYRALQHLLKSELLSSKAGRRTTHAE